MTTTTPPRPPVQLEPDNRRRLQLLFDRAVRHFAELRDGGQVVVTIRKETGRVSRGSRITVDEFPLTG